MSAHTNLYTVKADEPTAVVREKEVEQALQYSAQATQAERAGRIEEVIRLQQSSRFECVEQEITRVPHEISCHFQH